MPNSSPQPSRTHLRRARALCPLQRSDRSPRPRRRLPAGSGRPVAARRMSRRQAKGPKLATKPGPPQIPPARGDLRSGLQGCLPQRPLSGAAHHHPRPGARQPAASAAAPSPASSSGPARPATPPAADPLGHAPSRDPSQGLRAACPPQTRSAPLPAGPAPFGKLHERDLLRVRCYAAMPAGQARSWGPAANASGVLGGLAGGAMMSPCPPLPGPSFVGALPGGFDLPSPSDVEYATDVELLDYLLAHSAVRARPQGHLVTTAPSIVGPPRSLECLRAGCGPAAAAAAGQRQQRGCAGQLGHRRATR